MILDHRGNPIQQEQLTEPQTSRLGALHHEIAEHPSRGLTPVKLARILQDAEQGNIIAQCDLFEDMEEKDGHIFSEMSKRKRALLGMPWDIAPPLNATAQEKKWAEEIKEYITDIEIEDIIFDMGDAIGKAFSCLELAGGWKRVGKTWLPADIEFLPQRMFQVNQNTNEIRLRDNSSEGEELWPFGWIQHVHKARSGYLARTGLHRTLAWPYLFKNYSVRDLAEFLEIYGLPLRLGTYPRGATSDEKTTLLNAVLGIGHDAAGIVPEGMMIDFKEAADGRKDPFEFMIEWCEKTESKVIVGATLTSQTDSGSGAYALGEVHMEVMRDLVISDARQVAGTLTRYFVYPIAALNISGMSPDRAPRFIFDTHECEDIKTFSESLPELVDIGMQIPEAWAKEKLGIPDPAEGEAVLRRPAPVTTIKPSEAALKSVQLREKDIIDDYADRLDGETAVVMDGLIEPIRKLVMSASSLEEIRDGLINLYPDYDAGRLGVLMQRAFTAADLLGRFEVQEDI